MINSKELGSIVFEARLPKPRSKTSVAAAGLEKAPKPHKIAASQIPAVFAAIANPTHLTIENGIGYAWLVYHFARGKKRWNIHQIFKKYGLKDLSTMATMYSIQPTTTVTYSHAYALFLRYIKCTFPSIKKIENISHLQVAAFIWFESYRRMAPSTISTRLSGIKHFLGNKMVTSHSLVEKSLKAVTLLFARKKKKAHPLRLVHIAKFMRIIDWKCKMDVRDAYAGYLLAAGWLRVSELTGLKWDDVTFEILKESVYGPRGTFIQLIEIETSKTKVAGDVIIIAAPPHFPIIKLKKLIKAFRTFFPDEAELCPYIFRAPRDENRPMANDCVRRIVKRIARRIGEKNWHLFTAHSGRVGGVTDAAAAGISEAFMRWHGRWDSATFYGYFQDYAFASIKTTLTIANHTMKIMDS